MLAVLGEGSETVVAASAPNVADPGILASKMPGKEAGKDVGSSLDQGCQYRVLRFGPDFEPSPKERRGSHSGCSHEAFEAAGNELAGQSLTV
jgi:hypothetical protein